MKVKAVFNPFRGILLLLLFTVCGLKSFAQTDTEFWFVIPDITYEHQIPGGEPAKFTFSTFDMPSTVTVSMPANPSFTPIIINIPAGSAYNLSMDNYINTAINASRAGNPDAENQYKTLPTPTNPSGANKCGLKITATTPITAYYQDANINNTELYALKGKNALGNHFFVPFQNQRTNHGFSNTNPAYSSINIVATKDNTVIHIKPSQDAYMHGTSIPANADKTVTLMAGEAICVVPKLVGGQPDRSAAGHLAGTEISSSEDVAITINDDSVHGDGGGNYDIIGDQLVNMASLGLKYVVLRTKAQTDDDRIYVTATEDNTTVKFYNNNGNTFSTKVINAGEQCDIGTVGDFCIVDVDKKVTVLHVGGYGGELGGAILPAIDKCTGSTQVAFNKLNDGGKTFNTNVMVRTNGKNEFYLNGVKVNMEAAAGKTWTQLPGTDWWFMQVLDWNTGKFPSLKQGQGNILTNKGDLFHLGVFYGASSGGCNYGFFSDFNELKIDANVAGVEAGETKVCFGAPIQLYAKGGTTYKWTPVDYLSDPAVFNPIANIPFQGVKQYQVEVSGACNMKEVKTINLQILPPVKANFSVDNITGCSPLTVNFTNTSLNAAELRWSFGDTKDTVSNMFKATGLVEKFSHLYVNNTDTPITYTVQLIVKSESGCGDVIEKQITVYPSVEAKMNRIDPTPSYCSPRSLTFENVSPPTALPASDITYIWDFGDGGSVNTSDPTVKHDFSALNKDKLRYDVSLTMINKFGCKSIAKDTIDVYGKVDASFSLDKISGCPDPTFNAVLTDGSTGPIKKRTWDWSGFSQTPSATLANAYDISTTSTSATTVTRTIKLDVEGAGGCKDSYKQDVTIYPYVNATFSFNGGTDLCDGEMLNISKFSSGGATDFLWEFGDGSTSTEATPAVAHLYNNASYATATYDVRLTVKSSEGGCQSTYVSPTKVKVFSRIDPDFSIKDLGGCAPFNATILNVSKGNASNKYEWNFKDGSAPVVENTLVASRQHLFTNSTTLPEKHFVELTVTNEGGCFKTVSRLATVYPQPVADFTVDNSIGCNPLPVAFTASTSAKEYDYQWSFDDGATGSQPAISHTYNNFDFTNDATFNPTLEVSSIYGCKASITKPIKVHPFLKAAFTVQQLSACAPFDVKVTPNSLGATSYAWDYGDGRTATKTTGDSFTISYDNTGATSATYPISLVATNSGGACQSTASTVPVVVDPRVVANGTFTVVDKCTGAITFNNTSTGATSYTWDFGDGQSASVASTAAQQHTYENRTASIKTYTATLTAENAKGCKATKTFSIDVVPRVESSFTYDVVEKCTPMKIHIINTSLNGTEFQWDYGHTVGGVAQQDVKTVKDAFDRIIDSEDPSQVKTYTLKLTTLDKSSGCSAVSTKDISVYPRVKPSFTSSIIDKCTGKLSFQNATTGAITYTWNFGDMSSSYTTDKLDPVAHTYLNRSGINATFNAKLIASNSIGCSAEFAQDISIVPLVESSFTMEELEKCTPVKVKLTNTSLNGSEFKWDYGHTIGGIAQQETRATKDAFEKIIDSENLNQILTYQIKLTTLDKVSGCFAVSSKDLTVYPKVLPSFTSAVVDKCSGKMSFQNATTGATTYTWFFGDPSSAYSTDKLDPVSHTYLNRNATNATFIAKIVASNAIGCSAEAVKDISIVPRVESSFTLEELEVCTPVKVKLTNTSLNGQQFTWNYGHTIGGASQVDVKTDKIAFEKIIDSESANTVVNYPIKLAVLDKNTLCADDSTISLTVHPRLIPSFTSDKAVGCSDLPVVLTNTSTGGNLSFNWDFNDGQSVKSSDVTETVAHTFVNRNSVTKNYSVVLTATNAKGCKATASKSIGVYPKVEAAFTFVQSSKCTPFPIDIANSSLNGTEYSWDFGHVVNGNKRDTLTITKAGFRTYIYNGNSSNAQTYTLTLTARDAATGCNDVITKTVDAQPEVKSSFSLSTDKGCNPLTVSFTNSSTGSSAYTWNFGNNTSSASVTPASMVFTNSDTVSIKTYNIVLTSKNQDGCTNVSTKRVDVYPKMLADFSLDKVNGCTPLTVKVANAYPSSAYRYEWSLGSNGTSTSQQIPDLNFINSTTDYTIQTENLKLKVFYKGDATCYKEVERSVDIYPGTRSDFAMDVTEACNPLVINFTNETKSYNNSASYRWNFGSLGGSGDVNPKYTFTNLSKTERVTYAVKLKSTSIHGCSDSTTKTVVVRPIPKAQMAINTASGCAPFNVDVQNLSIGSMPTYTFWLDNDRTTSVVRNGNSNVQFNVDNLADTPKMTEVWLKTVSDFGCKDSISQKVYTYPHVTSAFTFTPSDAGCNPLTVNFANTSKNAIYYTWDFDDGVTAHVSSPSHVFQNFKEQDRVYNVKLKAKSEYGCEHVSSKDFTVFSAPIAYFTIDPPLRTFPDASFLFNNQTTPKAINWNYEWTFGDGGKYIGVDPPVYTYKTWGDQGNDYKYNVTLKVSNGNCKDEMTQFLYLKPAIPVSIFSSSVGSSCSPLETQFVHQAKFYKSIEWNFGDGTTSTEDSPYHVFRTPGKYHVQLTVKGDGGNSYSYTTLEVFPNPVASFKLAPGEAMLPEARVQFYNTSIEGKDYAWDFGDVLGTSTEKNPTYSYKKLGNYNVRLKVTSENGCVDDTLVKAAVKVVGEGVLKFPNAFIPNLYGGNGGTYEVPDYKNEVFHPTSEGVVVYKLLIYNRWGEKLFESDEIGKGWDGYYKGKLCEQGVYVYRATGRFTNGKTFDLRGDVTLLR
ncbi:PKD domain-containing protein [uncultured Acetobacteroides sp.]|uniref:PKD domain-containing protein n=1 Tax=uncultured Acetobacteroides sp. TaxID=1760811 RepID=UPI0029F54439|nr:PKD domain-containing protein [uncultured Acetobacteroides sp.]